MAADLPAENPFAAPSDLPYALPPFDRIGLEHYRPAFERGMAEQLEEIDAIVTSTEPATFENTVVALERSGRLLERVGAVFFNAVGSTSDEGIRALEAELAPRLAAHQNAIRLDARLFARIQDLYEHRDLLDLSDESRWLLERYRLDFVRAGAQLADADKERLRALDEEISALTTSFSSNVLAETNDLAVIVTDGARLAGLPADLVAGARSAAESRGLGGSAYAISLRNYSAQPALAYLSDASLRREIHEASVVRGTRGNVWDNRAVVRRLALARAERAQLLGYPSHAAYVIEDNTAGSVEAVAALLSRLARAAVTNAEAEIAALQGLSDSASSASDSGPGPDPLQAWDRAYWAEKLRTQAYDLDGIDLRAYFPLGRVLTDGVFYAAERLYGLRFVERHDLPVYADGVRTFEVFEESGAPLALLLTDFYARPSKRGGAWTGSFLRRSTLLDSKPVVYLDMNIVEPPAGEPTLLTFDEVRTLFHEFGHALHNFFSGVRYPRFAGTKVSRDFVEFPSQVNEMWALWPEVLTRYARHVETGDPLPAEVVERLVATRRFDQGFATTEYLAAALLDQAWHTIGPDARIPDVEGFERRALESAGVASAVIPPRYRTAYFSHAFSGGGYSAAYYGYIWAEVLDADAVRWFEEHGGLTRENGEHFRRTLLCKGGSLDVMQAYRDFRGRDPELDPLLRRRGLTDPPT